MIDTEIVRSTTVNAAIAVKGHLLKKSVDRHMTFALALPHTANKELGFG